MGDRIVIVGGPRAGKSWLADELADHIIGCAVRCGDPRSKVKEPLEGVEYLPEGLDMEDESTRWIVDNWFSSPGPWVCEGWIMARALRKWLQHYAGRDAYPCDKVIVFTGPREGIELLPGQATMHKGVTTVWNRVADYFDPITEYR